MNIENLSIGQVVGFTTKGVVKKGVVLNWFNELDENMVDVAWVAVDVLGSHYEVPLKKLLGVVK